MPPNPGGKVHLPYRDFIEDILSRDSAGRPFRHALNIGTLESNAISRSGDVKPLRFFLNSENLKNHLLIAGMPKVGKTHAATVIIEELANKIGLPVIILDPVGEYVNIGLSGHHFEMSIADDTVSLQDYPFKFKVLIYTFDPEKVADSLEKLDSGKARDRISINRFPKKLAESKEPRDFHEFVKSLKIKGDSVVILDGKDLNPGRRRDFYSSFVNSLQEARVMALIDPFVLIVDDALNLNAGVLKEVVSENEGTAISVIIVSSHPSELDPSVFVRIGTFLIGRMIDSQDIKLVRNVTLEKSSILPRLMPGEFIFGGIASRQPTKILTREKISAKA